MHFRRIQNLMSVYVFSVCACIFIFCQDEKYSHLEAADVEKLNKCLKQKSDWYEKQMNLQGKTPLHEPPVVTASQIYTEKQVLTQSYKMLVDHAVCDFLDFFLHSQFFCQPILQPSLHLHVIFHIVYSFPFVSPIL